LGISETLIILRNAASCLGRAGDSIGPFEPFYCILVANAA
jgi:hypothetical protein